MTAQEISKRRLTRRRFISVLAAAGAAQCTSPRGLAASVRTFGWEGIALGAHASLTLQHPDEVAAKSAIAACLEEVARLEAIFSLHRPDSALVRLNACGRLDAAPADLRVLLTEALALAELSDGAFDPTVQPLWALYARHFSSPGADPEGPAPDAIGRAKALIDWRKVEIENAGIRLRDPAMAVTLNGIAQGYITDRVGALLHDRGFRTCPRQHGGTARARAQVGWSGVAGRDRQSRSTGDRSYRALPCPRRDRNFWRLRVPFRSRRPLYTHSRPEHRCAVTSVGKRDGGHRSRGGGGWPIDRSHGRPRRARLANSSSGCHGLRRIGWI